eukprot:jgi/Botrbrau1/15790/Bobra.4_1s0141.1
MRPGLKTIQSRQGSASKCHSLLETPYSSCSGHYMLVQAIAPTHGRQAKTTWLHLDPLLLVPRNKQAVLFKRRPAGIVESPDPKRNLSAGDANVLPQYVEKPVKQAAVLPSTKVH